MAPRRMATFRIDEELLEGLRIVWDRDGVAPSEQIRRAIRMWLESKGVMKRAGRKRVEARKRP